MLLVQVMAKVSHAVNLTEPDNAQVLNEGDSDRHSTQYTSVSRTW
jgi:hypothetical protein